MGFRRSETTQPYQWDRLISNSVFPFATLTQIELGHLIGFSEGYFTGLSEGMTNPTGLSHFINYHLKLKTTLISTEIADSHIFGIKMTRLSGCSPQQRICIVTQSFTNPKIFLTIFNYDTRSSTGDLIFSDQIELEELTCKICDHNLAYKTHPQLKNK